jgi:8-oxo-dGTP diphosphatase
MGVSSFTTTRDQQRSFLVGGALIVDSGRLLLVGNRRRQGHLEWTPPGGVIDPGESMLDGIAREVVEETSLVVNGWDALQYSVVVDAPDMGWQMSVQCWRPSGVSGSFALNDPDRIVEQARSTPFHQVADLLSDAPAWIKIPVTSWIDGGCQPISGFSFILRGADRATARVEQV